MGSNENRFGDRKLSEWGSKARKEEAHAKKRGKHEFAVEDSKSSNDVGSQEEIGYEQEQMMLDEGFDFVPEPPKKRRKKDTKRWCRGKVGQEHDFVKVQQSEYLRRVIERFDCTRCGKKDYRRIS